MSSLGFSSLLLGLRLGFSSLLLGLRLRFCGLLLGLRLGFSSLLLGLRLRFSSLLLGLRLRYSSLLLGLRLGFSSLLLGLGLRFSSLLLGLFLGVLSSLRLSLGLGLRFGGFCFGLRLGFCSLCLSLFLGGLGFGFCLGLRFSGFCLGLGLGFLGLALGFSGFRLSLGLGFLGLGLLREHQGFHLRLLIVLVVVSTSRRDLLLKGEDLDRPPHVHGVAAKAEHRLEVAALDGVELLVIKAQTNLQRTLLIGGQDLAAELLVLDVHHGEAALLVACAQLGQVHLNAGRHAVEADGLLRHAGAHRCDRLG